MSERLLALQSLRDKLRVAMGPDPMLDIEAAKTFGWVRGDDAVWIDPVGARWWTLPPFARFTGSVDSILRLVPEGWHVTLDQRTPGWEVTLSHMDGNGRYDKYAECDRAPTAPLALLLAVVEARILEEEGHE